MNTVPHSKQGSFWQGFRAVLPVWLAAAPFALAYVIAARRANLSAFEIQFSSLTIFSGASQMAVVQLLPDNPSFLLLWITIVLLNLHFVLYGLSLSRHLMFSHQQKIVVAYMLTDVPYGITIAQRRNIGFLLGAEVSMFVAWNGFTLLGLWSSQVIPTNFIANLQIIIPLTFFVLLISTINSRLDLCVAILACTMAFGCLSSGVGRATLMVVCLTVPFVGVLLSSQHSQKR